MPGASVTFPSLDEMIYAPSSYLLVLHQGLYEAERASAWINPQESAPFREIRGKIAIFICDLHARTPLSEDPRTWARFREMLEPELIERAEELTALAEKSLEGIEAKKWFPAIKANQWLQAANNLRSRAYQLEETHPLQVFPLLLSANYLHHHAMRILAAIISG